MILPGAADPLAEDATVAVVPAGVLVALVARAETGTAAAVSKLNL
jgi:hypothetical protein